MATYFKLAYLLVLSFTLTSVSAIDIIGTLTAAKEYGVLVELLNATGVINDLNIAQGKGGVTLFAPHNAAIVDFSSKYNFSGLPAKLKAFVVKYHALASYKPRRSLLLLPDPVSTVATKCPGSFTFNVSCGSTIDTGVIEAKLFNTIIDQHPVAIYQVNKVLLPKEIFG